MNLRQTVFGLVFNLSPTHYHRVYDLYCSQTSGAQRRHFGFTLDGFFTVTVPDVWGLRTVRWCPLFFYRNCELILFGITVGRCKSIQINLFQHSLSVSCECVQYGHQRKFSLEGWNGPCSKSRAVCVWESFEFDIHIKTQTFACWWLSLPQEAKSWLFIYHLSTFLIPGYQEISTHSCASLTSEDITGLVGRSSSYYCKQTSDSYLYD